MALNDITFIEGQGGLGRPLPGQDFVSGIVFYGAYPSGFSTNNAIQKVFSLAGAEALGIVDTYSDETAAVYTVDLSGTATAGDVITVQAVIPITTYSSIAAGTYTLGSFTAITTSESDIATGITAAINAATTTTGFTASATGANVAITFPKGLGILPNTGSPVTVTISGTSTDTISATTQGVASVLAGWHYQLSEYFRIQPQGVIYVGVFPTPSGAYTFAELQTVQNYAGGIIRQMGVHNGTAFADSPTTVSAMYNNVDTIQQVELLCEAAHMPFSVIYSANMVKVTDLSKLNDLSQKSDNKVSTVIAMDMGGEGYSLYLQTGKSVTALGAALGAVSLAAVSQSIAWVQNFNMTNGVELNTIGFANGQLYTALPTSLLNSLNTYRYIFLRSFIGISGSYFNDSHCAISYTSDYAYIENNRTIDKAIRVVYAGVLPYLNGPIILNSDGTLSNNTIAYIEDQLVNPQLDQMVRNSDLSGYTVTINPMQNVLSTSKLVIAVALLSNGVARNIVVNIGYTQSL
jgi:hypothetical protein